MFAAFVLFATWIVLGLPAALILFPWSLITGNVGPLYGAAMRITRTGLRLAGIRVQVEWHQPLDPQEPCIFLSNHISNLDPPILLPLLPSRVSVFIKRSLLKIPILGYGMGLGKFIPVDRDGRSESAKESVDNATRVLASGIAVLSFVEGTRSRDGRLQAFKKGPFYLALESGAPVVPVSIHGTESMMRKGSVRIFPGTAHVTFHAPILPRNHATREDLMAAVRAAIASGLPQWMRDEASEPPRPRDDP
ncbi:MAG TPA: lysophospholipid acyltransferase family protein [Acidobacteriaceae bacterium]|jgi:1-acyl-sn-glycerol-3-phosphate acyltransferase|nr:lysophospholipid acyltransferase family protein [Acidobacteriaceae bacterium]